MKTFRYLLVVTLVALIFGPSVLAYEGATKVVASMNNPEKGEMQFGPVLLVPHDSLAPGKNTTQLIHRIPQSSLSLERIREERPGRATGTKETVLFWKESRI